MTPETLSRNNSKWPKVKILFIPDLFLTKCIRINSKDFYQKMLFYAIFQPKSKSFHLLVVVFLCILADWESYMISRRPIGAQPGRGSHRESSLLPIGRRVKHFL
jgi:hypothetical protein